MYLISYLSLYLSYSLGKIRAIMADKTSNGNINIIENSATGDDSIQYMVTTDEGVVHGRNEAKGLRLKQVGGKMDGASVQHISTDITTLFSGTIGSDSTSSENNTLSTSSGAVELEPRSEFQDRYGRGQTTGSVPTTEKGKSFQ